MKPVDDQRMVRALNDAKRCIINITLPTEGPPLLRSIEIHINEGRNRTSFTRLRRLEEVFEPGVAVRLYEHLEKMTPESRAMSLPDQVIEAKGVILAGIHMMVTYAKDGTASIIMRFRKMIGDLQHAMIDGFGFGVPTHDTRDETALKVLADISLPLLDICTFADADNLPDLDRQNPYLRHLAERAGEIRFQVELIKRYVEGLERTAISTALCELPANTQSPLLTDGRSSL